MAQPQNVLCSPFCHQGHHSPFVPAAFPEAPGNGSGSVASASPPWRPSLGPSQGWLRPIRVQKRPPCWKEGAFHPSSQPGSHPGASNRSQSRSRESGEKGFRLHCSSTPPPTLHNPYLPLLLCTWKPLPPKGAPARAWSLAVLSPQPLCKQQERDRHLNLQAETPSLMEMLIRGGKGLAADVPAFLAEPGSLTPFQPVLSMTTMQVQTACSPRNF